MTEHIEGDPCKFALWAGRTPTSDSKTILKVKFVLKLGFCLWIFNRGTPVPVFVDVVRSPFCWTSSRTLFLQASSMEVKQEWIRNIREVIQERTVHLKGALKEPIHLPKTPSRQRSISKRSSIRGFYFIFKNLSLLFS